MTRKAIYFVPVAQKYLSKWEYYQVDYDALSEIYQHVVVCSTLWQVIKSLKGADLVYCWWWHQATPVVLLSKLFGVKTQVTGAIHMFDLSGAPDFYKKSVFFRLSARLCFALADENLFISRDQFLQITSHCKVNNPKVVLSSLSQQADFSRQHVEQSRLAVRNANGDSQLIQFYTISWHTLDQYKRKGVFETLAALAMFKKHYGNHFKWVIAGGRGNGLEILRSRVRQLGLDDEVTILVDISQEEKRELFFKADLYIQPSWCEGFGNAVLESMSHGLPALVSRYTAQPEVVGQAGFVAMELTPEGISEQLLKFASLSYKEHIALEGEVLQRVEDRFQFSNRLNTLKSLQ